MELSKYIGSKIKYYRELNNMTQDDLAEALNTTRQSVSRYENGDRKTNQDILFDLAEIFNISINNFFPKTNNTSIDQIYNKLNKENQKEVYSFAQAKLDEQTNKNNVVRMPTREEMTLAAHAADPNKIFTKEEIQKIHNYLDELDAEYDRKHGINKNDDK